MKIKIFASFCLLLIFSISELAQDSLTKAEKKQAEQTAKAKKKADKEKAKGDEKDQKDKLNSRTVDIERLLSFPQDYVGKTAFVRRIVLDEMQAIQDGSATVYLIDICTPVSGYHPAIPNLNSITFVASESLAKQLFEHRRSSQNPSAPRISANVLFDTISLAPQTGQNIYFARIKCVQSVGFFNKTIAQFGDCNF